MKYRFGNETDIDLLSEWNRQLIQDEGHRNPMAVAKLKERMRGWLVGGYEAIIFDIAEKPVAYALYIEKESEIYLRQLFVNRGQRRNGLGRRAVDILRDQIWPRTDRLTVDVLTENIAAVSFWRSVGYKDYCLTLEIMPEISGEQQFAPDR